MFNTPTCQQQAITPSAAMRRTAASVSWRRLLAPTAWGLLMAAAVSGALAQRAVKATVPLSVTIGGLPARLSPRLATQRILYCVDNLESAVSNPSLRLREVTTRTPEWVQLPNGITQFQIRQETSYVGNFELRYGLQPEDQRPDVPQCSTGWTGYQAGEQPVKVELLIDGTKARLPSALVFDLGELGINQQSPQPTVLRRTFSAVTDGLGVPYARGGVMARGMKHNVQATYKLKHRYSPPARRWTR